MKKLNLMNFFHKLIPSRNDFVAVDIGNRFIKMVGINFRGNQPEIINHAQVPTPLGALEGDWDEDLLIPALSQLIDMTGLRDRRVITTLGGDKVMTRHIQLPYMSKNKIPRAIKSEAEKSIPVSIDDMIMSYTVLGEVQLGKERQILALLAAVPSSLVYRYFDIFRQSGTKISVIDLQSLSLWRVYTINQSVEHTDETVAVLDIGAVNTNFIVIQNSLLVLSRTLSAGGEILTKSLAETFFLDLHDAEEVKLSKGRLLNDVEAEFATQEERQINYSLKESLGAFVREIRRSLEYYHAQPGSKRIQRVVLYGGTSKMLGFTEFMQEELELSVETGNIPLTRQDKHIDDNPYLDPAFSIVTGLALREMRTNLPDIK